MPLQPWKRIRSVRRCLGSNSGALLDNDLSRHERRHLCVPAPLELSWLGPRYDSECRWREGCRHQRRWIGGALCRRPKSHNCSEQIERLGHRYTGLAGCCFTNLCPSVRSIPSATKLACWRFAAQGASSRLLYWSTLRAYGMGTRYRRCRTISNLLPRRRSDHTKLGDFWYSLKPHSVINCSKKTPRLSRSQIL